jgi:hypothetical protein
VKRRISFSLSFVGIVLAGLLGSALARQSVPPIEQASTLPSQRVYDWPELFPLEVGNEWVYSDGDGRFTVRVLREILEANRMKYFEVSGYLPDDTAKVRKLRRGPLGQILEYNPGGEDFLWYRFGNYRGAWRFETGGDVTCITGSRVSIGDVGARVDVPAGTFERTLRLDFLTRCADGGIVSEYFAGGVGLVERVLSTIAGPRIVRLVAAHVGASELPAASYGIEISLDRPLYYNNLMPPIIDEWPTARARLVVRNDTEWPVELTFPTSQRFDFIVRDALGKEILRWSDGRAFLQVIGQEKLLKESRSYSADIVLKSRDGKRLPAGWYTLIGFLTTQGSGSGLLGMTGTVIFEIRDIH